MKEFRHLENIVTLEYYREKCVGCGACSTVCPHGVFDQDSGTALLMDRDGCMECGACALNCPTQAISVRSGVGCAKAIFYGWLSAIPFLRRLFVPDACSS